MLKIKYLLISLFLLNSLSIFSMEEEKNRDLEKSVIFSDKNLDKILSTTDFIKKLPKEIWREVISYLKYEDNRDLFQNFLVQMIELDDLNAKKMAIDFYRQSILTSESLKEWTKRVANFGKNWKNQGSVKLIKNYLDILNKDFLSEIKFYNSLLYRFKVKERFWDKKIKYFEDTYTGSFTAFITHNLANNVLLFNGNKANLDQSIYEKNCTLALLDLKKVILIYKNKKSFLLKAFKNIGLVILLFVVFFPLICLFSIVVFISDLPIEIQLAIFSNMITVGGFVLYDLIMRDFNGIPGFLNSKKFIENYLKTNKISLSNTNEHFLKLLGHNRVGDITDINYV